MRKLLLLSTALVVLSSSVGCSCCQALIDCERRKNQWLRDHCCLCPRPAAIAPLAVCPPPITTCPPVAQPIMVAPPAPIMMAPQAQQQPIYAAPQAVCPPVNVCPQQICQPIQVCPQQCCPQPQYVTDPCNEVCEPMWCP